MKFKITYKLFNEETVDYEKKEYVSTHVCDINYMLNDIYHNVDTACIEVFALEDNRWEPLAVVDDRTKCWKDYSHKFYLRDY